MFERCTNFNSDLSKWNVSKVKYMNSMFEGCTKFNSDLSKWDVSKVKGMDNVFKNTPLEDKEELQPKFNKYL